MGGANAHRNCKHACIQEGWPNHVASTLLFPDKIDYNESNAVPICNTTDSTLSAFKLINALCVGCLENLQTLQELLTELFYSGVCVCVWGGGGGGDCGVGCLENIQTLQELLTELFYSGVCVCGWMGACVSGCVGCLENLQTLQELLCVYMWVGGWIWVGWWM